MKKTLLILLVLVMTCGAFASLGACTEDEITSVKIGYCNGLTPLSWTDAAGRAQGFDIEFASLVFKSLGISVEFVNMEEEKLPLALNGGTIDVIWSGFALDPSKKEWVYSNPYLKDYQVVVARQDSGFSAVSDIPAGDIITMKNCEVGFVAMEKDTVLKSRISVVNGEYVTDATVMKMDTDMEALESVRAATCSAALVSELSQFYFDSLPENDGVCEQITRAGVYEEMVVVSKNEKLMAKIDETMSALYTSTKDVESLAKKYNLLDFICIPKAE